jgi:triosephosphate isomerase
MNRDVSDVRPYGEALLALAGKKPPCEIVVCTPFLMIPAAAEVFRGSPVAVGAQDVSEADNGARTGEVSASQLAAAGAKYVIIGHSERREYHGEDDALVGRKLKTALRHGLRAIVCVGERAAQREKGAEFDVVRRQLREALYGLDLPQLKNTVIAYEPVWAIGTGNTASPLQAEEMCRDIRLTLRDMFGAAAARGTSVLYGGSMKPSNAAELLARPDIDGGLIGGASLNAKDFYEIVRAAEQ